MSMNSYVSGGRPVDEKYKSMASIWKACDEAGIEIPEEVNHFFDGEHPDDTAIWVDIDDCVTETGGNGVESWIVDVKKLPKDISLIKFSNSY